VRVTRIIESQPNVISAKVSYASQLAKVKAKNEMCASDNHHKLHFDLEREKYKANLKKIDLHPRIISLEKQKWWKKTWNFFKKKDK
jgi:hypothetical protein